ncbi:MAG: hypothetical protein PHZ02_01465 [Desulfocapsaceae bacterium]|nr:hypothetical protein [Desulfocapsaceae bacterium]
MQIIRATYDFVKEMLRHGWIFADNISPHIITHDSSIIFRHIVTKQDIGNVLEITCPENKYISICGRNHFVRNYPPHIFSLRCSNKSDRDISPGTEIIIRKRKEWILNGTELFYENAGNLSPIIGERVKLWNEEFPFPAGISISSGEILCFRVVNPNIDINKVELFMQADIWEKKE